MLLKHKANNPFYYTHAASGQEENPFLTDDAHSGEKSSGQSRNVAGPPARPPPPKTSSSAMTSKSAFDDLNDTIRVALSGSPLKSTIGGFAAVEQMGQQQHVAGMFISSSFQQHAFAPSQQQSQVYSSPVKGNVHNVSSNGGGSQNY